ncbi:MULTISPECIES: hypothetical protein [unclassified Sinorhizobium]
MNEYIFAQLPPGRDANGCDPALLSANLPKFPFFDPLRGCCGLAV